MSALSGITNLFNTVKEVDLTPLRQQALGGVTIAIIGEDSAACNQLANTMRRDPSRPEIPSLTPVRILDLGSAPQALGSDLIILLLDARKADTTREKDLATAFADQGQRVLVFINHFSSLAENQALSPWINYKNRRVLFGSLDDLKMLQRDFASAVLDLLPGKLLALGRQFPFFRLGIAHHLINDTCVTNAAYSLSTGLAGVVPMLDIPLYITDMVVLTKNQAFLVYKLGLALGLPVEWKHYIGEFGGVLGSGFLWRQIARSLIGLIPYWGIPLKVAVAYSGTYVVGQAVLHWYLTGRHVSRAQMQALYAQAFLRGKNLARNLRSRLSSSGRRKSAKTPGTPPTSRKKVKTLPANKSVMSQPAQLPQPAARSCPQCNRSSAADAAFCQYCGQPLI